LPITGATVQPAHQIANAQGAGVDLLAVDSIAVEMIFPKITC
jgi:hypothetical protein